MPIQSWQNICEILDAYDHDSHKGADSEMYDVQQEVNCLNIVMSDTSKYTNTH